MLNDIPAIACLIIISADSSEEVLKSMKYPAIIRIIPSINIDQYS